MQLQVAIDGRALVGNRTGIGVHTAEIARRLGVEPPPLIASHAPIDDRSGIEGCRFEVGHAPLGVLWQQTTFARIDADVLWCPHGTIPLASRVPSVATMHDLSTLTMPRRHELKTLLSFNLFIGRSIEKAARIACVSRAIAGEMHRSFGVSASKLEVVPNGVDDFFTPGAGGEDDYILYAGTLEPRKGIDDLVAAWRSLPAPRLPLILCGDRGWGVRVPDDVTVTGYVTRERLRELYRGARVFVYPSHHEGFGIPPLEAMACGAPVIATRTGAIPDYAEGAALLVAPRDPAALGAALWQLLGSRALRDELREAGPRRAALHGWDASALRMTELLAEAAR